MPLSCLSAGEPENPATEAALAALDAQFSEAFAWWAQVYDAESGG